MNTRPFHPTNECKAWRGGLLLGRVLLSVGSLFHHHSRLGSAEQSIHSSHPIEFCLVYVTDGSLSATACSLVPDTPSTARPIHQPSHRHSTFLLYLFTHLLDSVLGRQHGSCRRLLIAAFAAIQATASPSPQADSPPHNRNNPHRSCCTEVSPILLHLSRGAALIL